MKDAFLREFIKISDIDTELDTKEATVETEYSIGYKNNDSTEGGRIDIFVYDNKKNAIIIENKIYAGDQKNQLLRYYNYAFKNKFKFNIIYLTLYGDAASEDSVGNKNSIMIAFLITMIYYHGLKDVCKYLHVFHL